MASHPESEALSRQVDEAERKEKHQQKEDEEEKEEQPVKHEGTEGSVKHQDLGAMGAVDWPRDQEVEGTAWPAERVCHTHERAIPIQQTVEALDITEEGERKHEVTDMKTLIQIKTHDI